MADYVLCEDTRRARKLKMRFGVKVRLISFHEHNEKTRIPKILALMEAGKTFALISDAGTPLLSDPGLRLVRAMIEAGLPFTCIPGPSAATTALVLSGFETQPFSFFGFLPVAAAGRKSILTKMAALSDHTLIVYESPNRIVGLLREIGETLGDRRVAVCREMTKLHEEVIRGSVSEVLAQLSSRSILGEFTVVIARGEEEAVVMSDESIRTRFEQLQKQGFSRKDALKKLVKESGRSRNDLYQLLLR
jgi:16S rRNA (cytidine1402-2'-O)-methyltransferase